jgi:hypothetical protein
MELVSRIYLLGPPTARRRRRVTPPSFPNGTTPVDIPVALASARNRESLCPACRSFFQNLLLRGEYRARRWTEDSYWSLIKRRNEGRIFSRWIETNFTSARGTLHCHKTRIPCRDQLMICGLYMSAHWKVTWTIWNVWTVALERHIYVNHRFFSGRHSLNQNISTSELNGYTVETARPKCISHCNLNLRLKTSHATCHTKEKLRNYGNKMLHTVHCLRYARYTSFRKLALLPSSANLQKFLYINHLKPKLL